MKKIIGWWRRRWFGDRWWWCCCIEHKLDGIFKIPLKWSTFICRWEVWVICKRYIYLYKYIFQIQHPSDYNRLSRLYLNMYKIIWWLTATTNQIQKRVITIQRRWLIMPQKKPPSSAPSFYPLQALKCQKLYGVLEKLFHIMQKYKIYFVFVIAAVVFVLKIYSDSLIAMNIYVWRLVVAFEDVNKLEKGGVFWCFIMEQSQ